MRGFIQDIGCGEGCDLAPCKAAVTAPLFLLNTRRSLEKKRHKQREAEAETQTDGHTDRETEALSFSAEPPGGVYPTHVLIVEAPTPSLSRPAADA